ncbi:hypothetical protein BZL30_6415 [Mycobacterium kansasii]|uniref:Uncharacterized protein n=1 Tax=Mycobacterium kansasii TaxID=1768 RepID=A0A1V3WUI0_MYCKA|nr:hypothetical protein BZL30_6415 [Mycobacterium kansasii]
MPSIASSDADSTSSTNGSTSAPEQPPFEHGSAGASVGGRSRAPEAARPQGARATVFGRTSTEAPGPTPAPAGGLVICAENVRNLLAEGVADRELRAIDALGLRFPSPELVAAAAALFEPAEPWATGHQRRGTEPESGRFRITVGPGVVRLGWTNPVRAEKASQRQSIVTNVTLKMRSCKSETTPLQPGTMIRPSCLRHDGALRQAASAIPAVSSPSGPANPAHRCAAPSPN